MKDRRKKNSQRNLYKLNMAVEIFCIRNIFFVATCFIYYTLKKDRRDRMVVGSTTTYAINVYHH